MKLSAKPSAQGERILRALDGGRGFRRIAEEWHAGPLRAPAALMAELVRGGLVAMAAGVPTITAAGRARLTAGKDRPRRLLVERPVPDDLADATARSETVAARRPAPAARRSVTVNLLESPLGWLHARGHLDRRQFDAGERLRGDWTVAGLSPRVTMRWDAAPSARGRGPSAPLDPTLAGIAAKRRFDGAIDAAGKGLGDILWRVVCSGEGLETAEGALGWPKRSGKLVLSLALDRVADFYGLA